jgi:hypothetical protein
VVFEVTNGAGNELGDISAKTPTSYPSPRAASSLLSVMKPYFVWIIIEKFIDTTRSSAITSLLFLVICSEVVDEVYSKYWNGDTYKLKQRIVLAFNRELRVFMGWLMN